MTPQTPYFTRRIQELLRQPGPDGKPWSDRSLSRAAAALGHELSPTYVRQLRTGTRANPSMDVIGALADVFNVPVSTFYPQHDIDDDAVLKAVEVLQPAGAQAILARGEGHFTPRTLRMIAEAISESASDTQAEDPHLDEK